MEAYKMTFKIAYYVPCTGFKNKVKIKVKTNGIEEEDIISGYLKAIAKFNDGEYPAEPHSDFRLDGFNVVITSVKLVKRQQYENGFHTMPKSFKDLIEF